MTEHKFDKDGGDARLRAFLKRHEADAPRAPQGEWAAIEERARRGARAQASPLAMMFSWKRLAAAAAFACVLIALWPALHVPGDNRPAKPAVTASDEQLADFVSDSLEYFDENPDRVEEL